MMTCRLGLRSVSGSGMATAALPPGSCAPRCVRTRLWPDPTHEFAYTACPIDSELGHSPDQAGLRSPVRAARVPLVRVSCSTHRGLNGRRRCLGLLLPPFRAARPLPPRDPVPSRGSRDSHKVARWDGDSVAAT